MSKNRITYVVDTNILVDYVDIIPSGSNKQPEEPTVDLSEAHMVIPTAVIRELPSFKRERSERGKSARIVLRRIRRMVEGKIHSMDEVYRLQAPITITDGNQIISVLPVHKNFKRCLPFSPSEDDMDGQIILATLTIAFLKNGLPIDGTAEMDDVLSIKPENIVLLTNDNGLAIRARERGLLTSRYGYKYPEPYTGRRDIVVPRELFMDFYNLRKIERERFEELMPSERTLAANEFIVMRLENKEDYPRDFDMANNPYFLHIGRYDYEEDAIVPLKYVGNFPVKLKNAGQAIYAEALMTPNFAAVLCTGPAGSGKTYMATVWGYNACKNGEYIGVTTVPCENQSKLGALPGDLDEKMDPDVQPLKNALRNYILNEEPKFKKELENMRKFGINSKPKRDSECTDERPKRNGNGNGFGDDDTEKTPIKVRLENRVELIWKNWFSSVPIENARGRDFAYEVALYDEFQDQNVAQADTLIKRIGSNGKIILTGDVEQIHAPYLDRSNNGLVYASRQLFDNPMVAQVCFTEDEVIRHPLVRFIAKRQKDRKNGLVKDDDT